MAVCKTFSTFIFLTLFLYQIQVSIQISPIIVPSYIGASCSEDDRCVKFIPNSACRDGTCNCAKEYIPHSTNDTRCLKIAVNINDTCEELQQCTRFAKDSLCTDGRCNCRQDYHYVIPSQCILSKGLDEECKDDSDCYLEDDGMNQNTLCGSNKQCTCKSKYYPTSDKRSCKGSGVTNAISLVCLTGVWLLHFLM